MDEVKRGPGRPPKPELKPVKLLRNYWPMDGRGKVMRGSEIDLPPDEARNAISKGIAVRNDAF